MRVLYSKIVNSEGNKQFAGSNDYHATEELMNIESDLRRYNKFIVVKFIEEFRTTVEVLKKEAYVLDFGAGIGTLAHIWSEYTKGQKPICLEIDEKQRATLSSRGFRVIEKMSELTSQVEFIYTSNVIEHIDNDEETLRDLKNSLVIQGVLVIYAPAFQILFSGLDQKVGHYRRYSKRELESKLSKVGLRVKKIEYVDSVGFFAVLAIKLLGWRKIGDLGNSRSLRFYDKFLFPISKLLDAIGFRYLLGKNLYVVAVKDRE